MDFNLSFRKIHRRMQYPQYWKCTARIDMAVTVTVDDTIDFYDFSIIGRGTKKQLYHVSRCGPCNTYKIESKVKRYYYNRYG